MINLPGYEIYEQIHENNRIEVYRGYTINEKKAVVIKALKEGVSAPVEMSKLMYEYEMIRNLNIEGIIRPLKLEQSGRTVALILEDVGAVSLREYMLHHDSVNLSAFLHIAIQLSEILERIHQEGIIHGDLKPENILVSSAAKQVYIIDFSTSIRISPENKSLFSNSHAGSLEYMSPEQTDQLNIAIDRRSDLYSLGVVLYEIVTGSLPFQVENTADWTYAHLSRKPQSPDEINPAIPEALANIMMKLLEKDPQERYQSAYGLCSDLKECKKQLNETGKIASIPIGKIDAYSRFQLPRKCYGRQSEMEMLRAAFSRVCEGQKETILVSGASGIGKTLLINESLKSDAMEEGFFITGKVDQLRKNIPYTPFRDGFGNLVKQLMTENQDKLLWWKKRILHSIGKNGAVMTEIIPELEWVIGKQPSVENLSPKEAEHRFLRVFRDFIKVFAWKGHPLVLFLDDLQWADEASLLLLKYLMQDTSLCYLLFVAAFRENDVHESHPLQKVLEETKNDQLNKTHILSLAPLKRTEVANLVADTLNTELENVTSLAESLYRKSGGNPLSLKQLLILLHDEGLLYFDTQERCWKWDMEAIQNLQQGEDVLELILKKIDWLPEDSRELIKWASCIGNRFDLQTLAALWGKSVDETASSLMPSVLEGLVFISENEKMRSSLINEENKNTVYEFLHDRVQQAVYALINEDEKKEKHMTIGSLLLLNTSSDMLEEKIMSIMDHFNRSLEFIQDPSTRIELAGYNLLAGRKAKASAAYASALRYFKSGTELLADDAWEHHYRLSFDLYLELAQAQYLCSDVNGAEELFDKVLERAQTELERADVNSLKVILYAGVGKYTEAVQTGMKALKNLGINLPLHPTKLDYVKELLRYKWSMRNKKIEELINLPEMNNAKQRKITELLTRLSYVTMSNYPDLYGFIILKNGNYALKYGINEMFPIGCLGYGITVGNILGDYEAGEKYGNVCIQLAEKYDRNSSKCIAYFVTGSLIFHWTQHAAFGLEYLKKAVDSGMEVGDVVIVGYANCLLLENQYLMGVTLVEMEEKIRNKHETAKKIKHDNLMINTVIYKTVVNALMGRKSGSLAAGVQELEKDELLRLANNDKSSVATYYFCRMQLDYMMGNYRQALAMANKIEPIKGTITGFLLSAEYIFYHSLVIASAYEELSLKERKHYVKRLKKNERQLKKWTVSCKDNFQHKYLLVAAEIARLQNKKSEAMLLYDKAISSAQKYGFIQHEALASELAATFYLACGIEKIAEMYMANAYQAYQRWGAYAKAKELENKYPKLFHAMERNELEIDRSEAEILEKIQRIPIRDDRVTASSLDSDFIDKAIENMAKETDITKLLERFLEIAVQRSGADSGCLVFEENGELFIESLKDTGSDFTVVKTIPLEEYTDISKAVVYYVARTMEMVVLNNGGQDGIFASDPYIAESNPKSIACIPLLWQGVPIGVLYLENNFMPGVFAPASLKVLNLLSTQIAFVKKLQSFLEKGAERTGEGKGFALTDPLTERESEVLKLIGEGLSNKEIGEKLDMSVNTVKTHIKHIYGKLGVTRRIQAVQRARELHIL